MLLLFALLQSAFLLLLTNGIARGTGRLRGAIILSALFAVGGAFANLSVPLIVNAFFLCVAGLVLAAAGADGRSFLKGSLVATALAYGLVGFLAHNEIADYARYRQEYPFESLTDRLPHEVRAAPWGPAGESGPAQARLAEVEQQVDDRRSVRSRSLELMHASYVRQFVESPGFGALRMLRRPSPLHLRLSDDGPLTPDALDPVYLDPPADQPADGYAGSGADIQPVGEKEGRRLWTMHRLGVVEFLNPEGFGYIRGKDQVAGFQPHLFRRVPTFPPREGGDSAWVVERLELVSLLMHETPVVYVSEHLPRMDRVGRLRTRPLDTFEASSLPALQRGEDLMRSLSAGNLRILGAVRAGNACLSCHDAKRGDLLGAFSYKLKPEKPVR